MVDVAVFWQKPFHTMNYSEPGLCNNEKKAGLFLIEAHGFCFGTIYLLGFHKGPAIA